MRLYSQFPEDFVIFAGGTFNGKLHFLCSAGTSKEKNLPLLLVLVVSVDFDMDLVGLWNGSVRFFMG